MTADDVRAAVAAVAHRAAAFSSPTDTRGAAAGVHDDAELAAIRAAVAKWRDAGNRTEAGVTWQQIQHLLGRYDSLLETRGAAAPPESLRSRAETLCRDLGIAVPEAWQVAAAVAWAAVPGERELLKRAMEFLGACHRTHRCITLQGLGGLLADYRSETAGEAK